MSSRLQFILIGLLGGAAFWGLFDQFQLLETWRAAVPALVLAGAFFFGALAMAADLGIGRGLRFALPMAAVVAALAALKGLAFGSGQEMLDTGHVGGALVALATLPVPFAVALGLGGRAGLTDYRVLFTESWNIVVRYVSAGLFVGVALLVLWLLGALLELVGVTVLREVLRDDLGLWLMSGATFGLGLSVVTELSDTVSPYLLLRLLRLLTPLVLAVVVIFVGALPLRGLGALFGEISAASALLSTAIAAVALISIVADEDDVEAAQGLILTASARGLMALVPVLAGLAIWALALRVGQYGWTPGRVAAAALASMVAGYGLGYLAALSTGRRWREKLRQTNVTMAFAIIVVAALWLTPLVSPEAISVRSQVARLVTGQTTVAQLPLWEMKHDWGKAGLLGLEQLRARADGALVARLDWLDTSDSRWVFEQGVPDTTARGLDRLREAVTLMPAGTVWPDGLAETLAGELHAAGIADCARPRPVGRPGCVMVLADLVPQLPGAEAVFLTVYRSYPPAQVYQGLSGGGWAAGRPILLRGAGVPGAEAAQPTGESLIAALGQGPLEIAPVALNALQLGPWQVTLKP